MNEEICMDRCIYTHTRVHTQSSPFSANATSVSEPYKVQLWWAGI